MPFIHWWHEMRRAQITTFICFAFMFLHASSDKYFYVNLIFQSYRVDDIKITFTFESRVSESAKLRAKNFIIPFLSWWFVKITVFFFLICESILLFYLGNCQEIISRQSYHSMFNQFPLSFSSNYVLILSLQWKKIFIHQTF